ncbi:MAG: hypothetical protein SGI77_16670 [Pirellulaceae bacterium]|nr:hypothetical protein [Pirellulaceae bacterium]
MTPISFEPLKLISLGLAVLLLAPIAIVFWRITVHRPQPHDEYRAQLETTWREYASPIETINEDGSVTVTAAAAVQIVDLIGFSEGTSPWLAFYPRRRVGIVGLASSGWHRRVGIVGLLAVVTILVCVVVSLFLPVISEVMTPPQ